jgi:putative tryptophan/tyrosine transport system substrate-binding protein
MKRRELITLLGGAAAWPLAARAQQPDRMRRVGVLTGFAKDDPESQRRVTAFLRGLRELGWWDGRNVRVDFRWGAGDYNRIRTYAKELVSLNPDVILVNSSSVLLPLRKETLTIPIVFVQVNDPVGSGLVASLAHPGGNITGFAPAEFSLSGKSLEALKEIAPGTTRVMVFLDASSPPMVGMLRSIEAAGHALRVQVSAATVTNVAEIEPAVEVFAQEPNGALIVLASPFSNAHRALLIALAAKHQLPAIYPYRYFVTEGGLASYGVDPADQYRQAASYIDRILRGTKPGDLPVQQPTKFELVINLKTAKMLGLDVPATLLGRADEVIE